MEAHKLTHSRSQPKTSQLVVIIFLAYGILLRVEGRLDGEGVEAEGMQVVEEVAQVVEGKLGECHVVLIYTEPSTYLAQSIIR